jgi:hypothetical protein
MYSLSAKVRHECEGIGRAAYRQWRSMSQVARTSTDIFGAPETVSIPVPSNADSYPVRLYEMRARARGADARRINLVRQLQLRDIGF